MPEHSRAHWIDGRLVGAIVAEIVILFGISETGSTQIEKVSLFYVEMDQSTDLK